MEVASVLNSGGFYRVRLPSDVHICANISLSGVLKVDKRASYELGILHYVKLNDLVQLNSPQIIALTCHKCPSMYFKCLVMVM